MRYKVVIVVVLVGFFISCGMFSPKTNFDLNPKEFKETIASVDKIQILDVRTPKECAKGVIKSAIEIDWYDASFDQQLSKLNKEIPVVVYCASGGRSANALKRLRNNGFKSVYNLAGGYNAWASAEQ